MSHFEDKEQQPVRICGQLSASVVDLNDIDAVKSEAEALASKLILLLDALSSKHSASVVARAVGGCLDLSADQRRNQLFR